MSLADAVKAHVISKYGKQVLACEALKISQSDMSKMLAGKRNPSPVLLDDAGIEITWKYRER